MSTRCVSLSIMEIFSRVKQGPGSIRWAGVEPGLWFGWFSVTLAWKRKILGFPECGSAGEKEKPPGRLVAIQAV